MRTQEERLAEIRRRGMALRRKKRHRILGGTALCAALLLVGLWFLRPPETLPEELQDTRSTEPVDAQRLTRLQALLDTITAREVVTEYSMSDSPGDFSVNADDAYAAEDLPYCQITLTMEDGSRKTYLLKGHLLTDCDSGCHYPTTPEEQQLLLELIAEERT